MDYESMSLAPRPDAKPVEELWRRLAAHAT